MSIKNTPSPKLSYKIDWQIISMEGLSRLCPLIIFLFTVLVFFLFLSSFNENLYS